MPAEFRELYTRHDGQRGAASGLFYGLPFMPLGQVQMEWQVWRDLIRDNPQLGAEAAYTSTPVEFIKRQYIDLGWIPFGSDYGGNHLGIDLDPDRQGTSGQVINFGRDKRNKFVLGRSLREFLARYINRLEAGEFTISGEEGRQSLNLPDPANGHLFDVLGTLFKP